MLGTYPILIDGKKRGELYVSQDGLKTLFEAVCEDSGKMLRLSLYGDGEGYLGVMMPEGGKLVFSKSFSKLAMKDFPGNPAYAAPAGQAPLTPEALSSFGGDDDYDTKNVSYEEPEPITEAVFQQADIPASAAEPEAAPVVADEPEAVPVVSAEPETVTASAAEPEAVPTVSAEPEAAPVVAAEPEAVPTVSAEPEAAPAVADEPVSSPIFPAPVSEDTIWRRETGGALSCVQGDSRLLALPYNAPRLPLERMREARIIEGKKYAIFKLENGKIL